MRLGQVIGRVTLSMKHHSYRGERLMLTLPWSAETLRQGGEGAYAPAIVVYDQLGAGPGQTIAISEGSEASRPFPERTPVDAYCSALVDETFIQPET